MKVKKITLKNFRCYQDLVVNIHDELTVLVAINGEGKTSVLDALRIALWPFVSQFDLARTAYSDPANTITIDDVRIVPLPAGAMQMARQLPSEVSIAVDLYGNPLQWTRVRKRESKGSQTLDGVGTKQIKSFAEQLQSEIRLPKGQPKNLPFFGYYGTGRLWSHKRITSSKRIDDIANQSIRTFAYQDCLDPASSFRQFEEWFSHIYKVAREQQILALEHNEPLKLEETDAYQLIKVVQKAADTILSPIGWSRLEYSEKFEKSLIMHHAKQGMMKVNQLSDGIKNMLGMVADIAYRCALLNSHLGAAAGEETTGVVMIDEVDIHLHPHWQQTVLSSLTKAFPKLQFIVTTHSPQVVTTAPSECIRIVDEGQVYAAPKGSQGAEASRLLETIFKVKSRPPLQENTKKLKRYMDLVYSDQWSCEEAQILRNELDKIYANEEPQLLDLDLFIENRIWEQSLEED